MASQGANSRLDVHGRCTCHGSALLREALGQRHAMVRLDMSIARATADQVGSRWMKDLIGWSVLSVGFEVVFGLAQIFTQRVCARSLSLAPSCSTAPCLGLLPAMASVRPISLKDCVLTLLKSQATAHEDSYIRPGIDFVSLALVSIGMYISFKEPKEAKLGSSCRII